MFPFHRRTLWPRVRHKDTERGNELYASRIRKGHIVMAAEVYPYLYIYPQMYFHYENVRP